MRASVMLQQLRDKLSWFEAPKTVAEISETHSVSKAKARLWISAWTKHGWLRPVGVVLVSAVGRPAQAYVLERLPGLEVLAPRAGQPGEIPSAQSTPLVDAATLEFFRVPRSALEYADWASLSVPAAHTRVKKYLDAGHLFPAGLRRLTQPGPAPRLYCSAQTMEMPEGGLP